MKTGKSKPKSKTLKRIGLWATIWWGVSGAYVVLLVWASRNDYVAFSQQAVPASSLANWRSAIEGAYRSSDTLQILLVLIATVWVIGGWLWLRELKHRNISYKAAFKDLFLTIR